jgi:hypothetical protein
VEQTKAEEEVPSQSPVRPILKVKAHIQEVGIPISKWPINVIREADPYCPVPRMTAANTCSVGLSITIRYKTGQTACMPAIVLSWVVKILITQPLASNKNMHMDKQMHPLIIKIRK